MAVVKSKRSEGQLTVIVKANDLASYTIKVCSNEKNFPKHYRWCITSKIIVKLLPEKVSHERRKLTKLVERAKQGLMTKQEANACYESWKAHATGKCKNKPKGTPTKHHKRHTHALVLEMDKFYKNLWEDNPK